MTEWKTSIHSQAYRDPFFHAYWTKDKHTWVCLNCHAPLENQQPTLIKEIPRQRVEKALQKPNPQFDPDYQNEGVTCAACHVRDGVILGPFDDPPRLIPRSSIPASARPRSVIGAIASWGGRRNFIMGDLAAPMPNTRAGTT